MPAPQKLHGLIDKATAATIMGLLGECSGKGSNMRKTLKFKSELAKLILSGQKTSTWRLWDDKDLKAGDTVNFVTKETLEHFATVQITEVAEWRLGSLSEEEKFGHERYASEDEMYKIFSGYYGKEVNSNTPVKIIWFELLKDLPKSTSI